MKVIDTKISDATIIEPNIFGDELCFLMEIWNPKMFEEKTKKGACQFVQYNYSKYRKGILQRLYYQTEKIQGKCLGGGFSAEKKRQLCEVEDFAHTCYVTSEKAEFMHKCTDYHHHQTKCSSVWCYETLTSVTPVLFIKDELAVCIDDSPCLLQ